MHMAMVGWREGDFNSSTCKFKVKQPQQGGGLGTKRREFLTLDDNIGHLVVYITITQVDTLHQ